MTHVDQIRQSFEAFDRGDVEEATRRFDDETEVHTPSSMMNSGTYPGREGFLRWVGQWLDAWDDYRLEPLGFEALDDEHVLVPARQTARGKGSGVKVEMEVFWLAQVRDGRTLRLHLYPSRAEATRAAASGRS